MTAIPLLEATLAQLKDKVVVITGSAHGIGAATVTLLHENGAKVVHGDWDFTAGLILETKLCSSSNKYEGEAQFVQTDVTSYPSLLNLFDTAWKKYGKIDVAISNAGVTETDDWFDPKLSISSISTLPNTKTLDVNLVGSLYFARIAAVYLKQSPESLRRLVLVSSTAGFKETPGIPIYSAAKHGVLGLMRALRLSLIKTHGVTVNAICPWMTNTAMVDGIRDNWFREKLPVNTPDDVARVMAEVAVGSPEKAVLDLGEREKGGYNGRAIFVEGGRGWDIEEGINRTEEIWLGEQVSKTLNLGQTVLGDGTDWAAS